MATENKEKFKTMIGGQALIEGIMMQGPKGAAVSVRTPDGEIELLSSIFPATTTP